MPRAASEIRSRARSHTRIAIKILVGNAEQGCLCLDELALSHWRAAGRGGHQDDQGVRCADRRRGCPDHRRFPALDGRTKLATWPRPGRCSRKRSSPSTRPIRPRRRKPATSSPGRGAWMIRSKKATSGPVSTMAGIAAKIERCWGFEPRSGTPESITPRAHFISPARLGCRRLLRGVSSGHAAAQPAVRPG